MAELTPEEKIDLELELELMDLADADERALRSPKNASFGAKAAEVGRSVVRGAQNFIVEPLADLTWDVGTAAIPRLGDKPIDVIGRTLNELNPFGEADGADVTRQEFYDRPLMQSLTQEKLDRGISAPLDVAKTGAEWAPALINPSQSLARNAATVIVGGGGAGGGELAGGEIGEVIGGITGAVLGAKTPTGIQNLVKRIRDGLGYSKEQAEQALATFFRENVKNIDEAQTTVAQRVAAGEKGTTGQLAGDAELLSIEAGANTSVPAITAQRTARTERSEQIADDVRGAFGELPPAQSGLPQAQAQAQSQIAERIGASEGRLNLAVEAEADAARIAEAQGRRVATDTSTVAASEELASTLTTTQANYDKAYKTPMWEQFDALRGKSGAIETAPFKARLTNFVKRLSPTERSVFNDSYMKEMNFIEQLNPTARPSEIAFLVSRFKTITGNAQRTGSTTATEKFLTQLSAGMEDLLLASPEAGPLYQSAVNATKASTAQFNQRTVGAARSDPIVETLGQRLVKPGDAGAAAANDLAASPPEVIAQTGEYLKALAAREGLNAAFIDKYEGFLSVFPDQALVAELRSAASAETGLVQARTAATEAAAAEGAVQTGLNKSVIGEFATEPNKTMANLLAAKDPGARLDELITAIDNPAVVRDAFRESFVGSMSTSTGGVTKVTPKAVEDFQRMYPTLQRLFADAPTELRAIQTAVERTKVDLLRESIPGTKLTSGLDELDSLLASAGAATVLEMGFTGTHALMVGGAIRRQIMSMLGKGQIDPAKAKVLSDMVANPQEFLRILATAPHTPNMSVADHIGSAITAMAQPSFVGFQSDITQE